MEMSKQCRLVLAVDIGSSSIRCSAFTIAPVPTLVPSTAIQIKQGVLSAKGTAKADLVVDLVEDAVDKCLRELRSRNLAGAVDAVGFACFGMNLVGLDESYRVSTPVYTYANLCPGTADAAKRLREVLQSRDLQGLDSAHQRTGAPVHGSYAPVQLLRLLTEEPEVISRVKLWQTLPSLIVSRWCCMPGAPVSFSEASWTGLLDFRKLQAAKRTPGSKKADFSMLAHPIAPVNICCRLILYGAENLHMCSGGCKGAHVCSTPGLVPSLLEKWDEPTLSILEAAGFQPSTLPLLADVGGISARIQGHALQMWPELECASVYLGIGDGAAASVGSGCDAGSDSMTVTIGTSAAVRLILDADMLGLACDPNDRCVSNSMQHQNRTRELSVDGGVRNGVSPCATAGVCGGGVFRVPPGLWCYRLDYRRVVLGGALTDGGSVFDWLCCMLGLQSEAEVQAIMKEVSALPPADHGLVMLPFLSGERSPGYNDDARATISGVRRSTTRAELIRAGLEAVCLRLAEVVDLVGTAAWASQPIDAGDAADPCPLQASLLSTRCSTVDEEGHLPCEVLRPSLLHEAVSTPPEGSSTPGPTVVASGAALASSPVWRQILADVLGKRVHASGVVEETLLGVAMVISEWEEESRLEGWERGGNVLSQEVHAIGSGVEEGATDQKVGGGVSEPDVHAHRAFCKARLAQKGVYDLLYQSR